MKEFIFFFRGGKTSNATEEQLQDHEDAWDDWMDELEEGGKLIDGLPLRDRGVMVTSDGMQEADFSTDHGITGYLILECTDLDDATEIASDCPIHDFGGMVEVRELINER
ncbi:MAG: YciI family protein [Flavobacteriales bacterium]